MGGWSWLIKGAKEIGKVGAKAVKGGVEGVAGAVTKPLSTMGKAATTAGGVVAGAEAVYLGKKSILDGQSVGSTLADQLGGTNFKNVVSNAVELKETKQELKLEALRGGGAVSGTPTPDLQSSAVNLGAAATGNGTLGLGRLFSDLSVGNLTGLGIAGLVASAMLIFGRHGILGKVAGLMLGITLLNSQSSLHNLVAREPSLGFDEQLRQSRVPMDEGRPFSIGR